MGSKHLLLISSWICSYFENFVLSTIQEKELLYLKVKQSKFSIVIYLEMYFLFDKHNSEFNSFTGMYTHISTSLFRHFGCGSKNGSRTQGIHRQMLHEMKGSWCQVNCLSLATLPRHQHAWSIQDWEPAHSTVKSHISMNIFSLLSVTS